MIEKQGDLFTTTAPAIGHGVNVFGVMGAGIATVFRDKYPEMFAAYKQACQISKLNPGDTFPWDTGAEVVYNMASQYRPGPDAKLEWLESAARGAAEHAASYGIEVIAIPRIGCGIGGLEWDDVKPALEKVEQETGVEFEVWTL